MNDLQKEIYSNMRSMDRVMLWIGLCKELIDFSNIMTSEDIRNIQKIYKCLKEEAN